jgi:hypothetical protein
MPKRYLKGNSFFFLRVTIVLVYMNLYALLRQNIKKEKMEIKAMEGNPDK